MSFLPSLSIQLQMTFSLNLNVYCQIYFSCPSVRFSYLWISLCGMKFESGLSMGTSLLMLSLYCLTYSILIIIGFFTIIFDILFSFEVIHTLLLESKYFFNGGNKLSLLVILRPFLYDFVLKSCFLKRFSGTMVNPVLLLKHYYRNNNYNFNIWQTIYLRLNKAFRQKYILSTLLMVWMQVTQNL